MEMVCYVEFIGIEDEGFWRFLLIIVSSLVILLRNRSFQAYSDSS